MVQNAAFLTSLNLFWFAVLPYVALFTFFGVTISRYRKHGYSYSSLSSQFLENRVHFWGMVPFHYGIITLFFGHLIGFLIPSQVLIWNSNPLRLYVLEITAFIAGLFTLIGMINLFVRRMTDSKTKAVTSPFDWIVLTVLFLQVITGLYTAVFHSWGSSWFAASMAPYLWSLLTFTPDIAFVTPMPVMVKLHIIGNSLIVLMFPFTRLVHILVVPNPYLWRKPQLVRWNWDRKKIRTPEFVIKRK